MLNFRQIMLGSKVYMFTHITLSLVIEETDVQRAPYLCSIRRIHKILHNNILYVLAVEIIKRRWQQQRGMQPWSSIARFKVL